MPDLTLVDAERAACMSRHPAGKELFPARVRVRSRFIVRYDAIITVVVASLVAFCLGMAAQYAIDHAPLPPCTDSIAESGGMCQGPLID